MRTQLLLVGWWILMFLSNQVQAQDKTLTGKVTDEKGVPVSNVSVTVKGLTKGTSTQADGSFSLSVPPTARTIVFSSIGFETREIGIGARSSFEISLVTATDKDLQDVVVVGYGTQKKSDLTSAVTKVGGDKVANVPFTSIDQTLQGKAAGLNSTGFSGQPGANQEVRIRGIGSYGASTQPLYVIDGIQINSGDLQTETIISSTNPLANLNPDDVESISVLKDAAATAIYGARGSNGVIIVTTKHGRVGKTQINATGEVGNNRFGNVQPSAKPLDSHDWLALLQEGLINAGVSQAQAATTAASFGTDSTSSNWEKLVTRLGTQQQYNVSASGGEGKTTFYVSGGYFKQLASTIGADLTRYGTTIKLDHQASSKLSFSLNLQPSYIKQDGPLSNGSQFGNPVLDMFFLRPTQLPYNPNGTLNISTTNTGFASVYNPLYIAAHNIHTNGQFSGIGSAQGKYNILDNLSFTSKYGIQYLTYNEYQYDNPLHGDGKASNGRGFADYTQYFLWDWTNQLDYHVNLNKAKDFRLDAKLGYESILNHEYYIFANAQNFPTQRLDLTANASTSTLGTVNASDYSFASVFSNATLNYKEKYLLSGNFRDDASSRFSAAHKYANFPAIGLGWIISKEDFMDQVSWISNLKLRASYGSAGNAEIPNYGYLQSFGFGTALNYNNQPGGGFNTIGNPVLTWEKDLQTDVGIDLSLFHDRISVIADYYDKENSKLLFANPISLTTGFPNVTENIGKLSNKGEELTINATAVNTRDFSWNISVNITHNKNAIEQLPPGQTTIVNTDFIEKKGSDINTWYMREWAGVDPATGNPLWYTDSSKKATTTNYNAAARVVTGKSADPKYYGGFSNTFSYKGFSLTADMTYNFGNYIWDQWAFYLADEVSPTYGKYGLDLKRWQKPGDVTNVPKLVYNSANFSSSTSTRFLYNGSYLRLRNVTLGYTVPPATARKMHMASMRAYIRGTNLWTKVYDKNLTLDPEQGGSTNAGGGSSTVGTNNLNVLYNIALTAGLSIGF